MTTYEDHDIHGLVIYVGEDDTLTPDPCCGCELCDCPECEEDR